MRKILTAAMAALTLGGGAMATAVPAQAEPWGHEWHGGGGWRGGHDDGDAGAAIFAGVAGLALGAALADSHPRYDYDRGYYQPYYGSYGYDPYRVCYGRTRVWDPYYGGYVIEQTRYAC